MPVVLTRQYVENERKCFSGSEQLNSETHCHGILEAKSINRTKMGRNGHQITVTLFLSQKSLKARIARRWEDVNGECCYDTSPSLCCFHLHWPLLETGGLAIWLLVLCFKLHLFFCVLKASGSETFKLFLKLAKQGR